MTTRRQSRRRPEGLGGASLHRTGSPPTSARYSAKQPTARAGPAPARLAPTPARPGAAAPPRKPHWRRMPEARPSSILSAALDSFVENGFAATRLDDVARRAGVSKGTLYLYFDSKEALLESVVRENIVPFLERAEQRVDGFQGSSSDLLVEIVRDWWEAMRDSAMGALPKLVLSEASNFPAVARVYFDEVVQRLRGLLARLLRRGIERGEFRDVDVEYAVRALTAPIVHVLIWKHSMIKCQIDAIDYDRYIDAIIDLVLHGLSKPPSTAAGDA